MARGSNRTNAAQQQVPEEIKEYYQAKKRDRMWVVWLLTAATFVVTVLVVLGLFWGGRWLVNRMRSTDGSPATVQTNNGTDSQAEDVPSEPQHTTDDNGGQGVALPPSDQPAQNGDTQPTPPTTPAPAVNQTIPETGSTELPRTGPTSDD